jgi:hypothetical protein
MNWSLVSTNIPLQAATSPQSTPCMALAPS